MVTPILLIHYDRDAFHTPDQPVHQQHYYVQQGLQKKFHDYHVLTIPTNFVADVRVKMEVFNIENATPISIKELEKYISSLLNIKSNQ